TYITSMFFFFQAEDGIRYFHVTGVQTCALPISTLEQAAGQTQVEGDQAHCRHHETHEDDPAPHPPIDDPVGEPARWSTHDVGRRSEERRVGKERRGRCWWRGAEAKRTKQGRP